MSVTARLKSLEQRKSQLDRQIQEKQKSPAPDSVEIKQLKQQKLGLKDEMEKLREREMA
jgi:hypothetical protein